MAYWGNHPDWQRLSSREKAAAMALLEADQVGGKIDPESAKNALGAMINRAARDNVDIGQHVSGKIYQPTIEDAQFSRLGRIINSPEHQQLMALYDARTSGQAPDWVNGATHFLAPEKTMLSLEARDPAKYRSWRQWTGFDDNTGEYKGVTLRDRSHAFLAPEGAFSAKFGDAQPGQAAPGAAPAAVPSMVPATTEATADTSAAKDAPAIAGGWLGTLQREPGVATAEAAPPLDVKGGLLAQLGQVLDPEQKQGQRPGDPMSLAPEAAPLELPRLKPGRVDVQRLASIIQARQRLGS